VRILLDESLPRTLTRHFSGVVVETVFDRGWSGVKNGELLRRAAESFDAARAAHATVLTKDSDFVSLLERLGAPPQLIWLRVGNCSNQELERILKATLPTVL